MICLYQIILYILVCIVYTLSNINSNYIYNIKCYTYVLYCICCYICYMYTIITYRIFILFRPLIKLDVDKMDGYNKDDNDDDVDDHF